MSILTNKQSKKNTDRVGGGGSAQTNTQTVAQTSKPYVNEYNLNMNAPSYARAAVAGANSPVVKEIKDTEVPGSDKPPTTEGSGGYGSVSYGFTPSNTYQKAMEYTNQLLEQLSSGRTSYTDKINSLMDQISNRDPFSYDMDKDTLFQNSLQSAMQSGQVAMQNTMGQAAALTGGYGSTYATSAANQAYNAYIQDAYQNLPDYYNMALDAYNMEGQNMYNQLGMYQTADDAEYNRLAAAYSANAQRAATLYDQEYNNYWQSANQAESSRRWAAEMDYKKAQAEQSQANWEKEYALDLIKSSSGSSNITDSQRKTAYSNVLAGANKWGFDSDKFADTAASVSNQYGIPIDELLDYAETNMDSPDYTLVNGGYINQWGGSNDAEPSFTLVEAKSDKKNNVYKDQYGKSYTRVQLEQMGYKFDSKGKVKKG